MTKLTEKNLLTLTEGYHSDDAVEGLRFYRGKRKSTWSFATRTGREPIGAYPAMSLAEARNHASRMVGGGAPPAEVTKRAAVVATGGPTLGAVIKEYEAYRIRKGEEVKTLDHSLKMVRNNLDDHLKQPIKAFGMDELIAVHDAIAVEGGLRKMKDGTMQRSGNGAVQMADRFVSYLRPVLSYAVYRRYIATNFARDILKAGANVKRERFLSEAEIAKLWDATDSEHSYDRLIRFLLLTGQRLEEASTLRYGDILDGVWMQRDNKSDRPVKIKLAAKALEIVRTGEARELVFPGQKVDVPMSGWSKLKAALDERSGVTDWRQHDLRRTMSTWMNEKELAPPHIVELCLNHSVAGVAGVYNRADMVEAKHAAWTAWEGFVLKRRSASSRRA